MLADRRAFARQEIEHTWRERNLFHQLHELRRDDRRIVRGFQHNRVACDDCRCGHSDRNRQREIPRWNDNADAERDVFQFVGLERKRRGRERLRFGVTQRLSRVKLHEVNRLGGVGFGFGPGLADLVNHPGVEFVFAPAHHSGGLEEVIRAVFSRDILPGLESLPCGGQGFVGQFFRAVVNAPDDLVESRWVERIAQIAGRVTLAADDYRVLAAQLRFDPFQSRKHLLRVTFVGKIPVRFVFEYW